MIYCFGDTHGGFDIEKIFTQSYAKDDYVVICGDFGMIWSDEKDEHEKSIEALYNELPCEVLFVDGNHENFNRLDKLPQVPKFGDFVGAYSEKIFHLKRGRIYTIDGINFFVMGGALSIDKARRVEGLSWWDGERISKEQVAFALKNIAEFKGEIDFVLTHTIPANALPELGRRISISHKIHDENPHKLEQIFDALMQRKFPIKAWIFGHWHSDMEFKLKFGKKCINFYALYNFSTILIDKKKKITKKHISLQEGVNF